MCRTRSLPGRRDAFTLIEMLVVIALILVIFSLGIGYVVFGQDNQHSVSAAQTVTGAMLNARGRAHRDGVPTGIRILFAPGKDAKGNPVVWASQLQLVQQPEDYNAGQLMGSAAPIPANSPLTFTTGPAGVDFQGGAAYPGQIDESTVQAGDYFTLAGVPIPHRINKIDPSLPGTIYLDSPLAPFAAGTPYAIIRAPRRLPSEDVIQLPPSVVIDDSTTASGWTLCQNLPQRSLIDMNNPAPGQSVAEIVFAPSGAVVGQGTGADKVLLWLRDPNQPAPTAGAPLLLSVQIRTGLIGVYPVAPANLAQPIVLGSNDPYSFVKDPRASGL